MKINQTHRNPEQQPSRQLEELAFIEQLLCASYRTTISSPRQVSILNTVGGSQCLVFFHPTGFRSERDTGRGRALLPAHTRTPCLKQHPSSATPCPHRLVEPLGPRSEPGVQAAWSCASRCQEPVWGAESGPVQGKVIRASCPQWAPDVHWGMEGGSGQRASGRPGARAPTYLPQGVQLTFGAWPSPSFSFMLSAWQRSNPSTSPLQAA